MSMRVLFSALFVVFSLNTALVAEAQDMPFQMNSIETCQHHPLALGYTHHPEPLFADSRFFTGDLDTSESMRLERAIEFGSLSNLYRTCELPDGSRAHYFDTFNPDIGAVPHAYVCQSVVSGEACFTRCQFFMMNLTS